jgi:hypothetical protein
MNTPLNIARGLGAIFIGFLALAGIDTILTALTLKFFFASLTAPLTSNQTIGLLAVKALSGLVAGYITATLAGARRWQHALILAGIILSVGLLSLLVMRAAPRSAYTTYALLLSPLSIVVGGWLRHRKA